MLHAEKREGLVSTESHMKTVTMTQSKESKGRFETPAVLSYLLTSSGNLFYASLESAMIVVSLKTLTWTAAPEKGM